MWGQKFGYVVGSALSFPFKNFEKVMKLYFVMLLILGVIVAFAVSMIGVTAFQIDNLARMQEQQIVMEQLPFGMMMLLVISIFIGLLSIIPYYIGIIRVAATGETADASVLSALLQSRTWLFIWAIIKLFLVLLPVILVGLLLTFMMAFMGVGVAGAGGGGAMGFISFMLLFITMAIVGVRLYFAPVLAALDKGTSLSVSWNITRGNWWLIFLSILVVSIVVAIAQWVILFLGMLILVPLAMIIGAAMAPVGIILYLAIILLAMMPSTAALGHLYLVLTDQVNFSEPDLKVKQAK